ncbi:MAG: protein kinase, partial [Thermoanaerobaculia bacterium]|nr:protein kinase [Thermoanaerobaculia bacterium]
MPLQPGARLGDYEVVSRLGAGGMGEVYRARDLKLGREVAIKLLLEEVADDPERLARFHREARVLASLNHANVATLYGAEQDGDTHFLVMELVEGATLADRIGQGPVPLDEVVPLFLQIAAGLEAAHEKGVVHRDLKPANVKVPAAPGGGGAVKILDFGLAKALADDPAGAADGSLSASPTLTLAATRRGEILGTAAYMSPEQVRGRPVDKRADIWAFGCCLLEALTGRSPFAGETASDAMANVLTREPDPEVVAALPAPLRRLLERCLEKDVSRRLRDIGDARFELEAALSERDVERREAGAGGRRSPRTVAVVLASLAGLVVGAVAVSLVRRESLPVQPVRRFTVAAPVEAGGLHSLALSPDGSKLVMTGAGNEDPLLLRRMDRGDLRVLEGTERGEFPFFSPDGRSVAFFTAL